jgi:hypothetical protein
VKTGTSNPKQVKILIALLLVAGLSVGRMVLIWGRPAVPAAAAAKVAAAPAARTRAPRDSQRRRGVNLAPSEDPRLRLDLLKSSENTNYEGTGRNIFQPHMEEIPQPIMVANSKQPAGPVIPQGPPPPPPINLKFFGFASEPGEPKKVFLVQGGDVFIAGEGDIVDRRYKVIRVQPLSVEIQDVLNNHTQTIPLQQS